ncbi:hypothetical protein E1B28_000278 [Marasmius oreades]|uniref:NAD(P)-binding protein n=1 Tax=Marasmius oreades TaxID=181124 RepID=A0A9P7V148_9AGAR|nr:uncharacterized protein E1B28_000278 [Marasmius oreades]KAG7098317.1 hypothetical protein E1B28_000278 [Marasmius oreades]
MSTVQAQDTLTSEVTAIHIPDDELFRYAGSLRDKVVVITGASAGIGKETATKLGAYGAKVVIGDLDFSGSEKTVEEIRKNGGKAFVLKCDVTVFDDIVALYEFAMDKFGAVDIVIPNAGVTEIGRLGDVRFDENGKPKALGFKTIQVNLIGVLNTLHLAQYYLLKNRKDRTDLKAVILLGSVASWLGLPGGAQYTASKHAVLGLMRSMHPVYERMGIRIATIHPFFADTAIVPVPVKIFLSGIPLVPIPRIAGAIIYAASNPDRAASGCAYMVLDDGPVFRIPKEEFKLGVYKMIDERSNALFKAVGGMVRLVRAIRKMKVPLVGVVVAIVSWGLYGRFGKQFGLGL